MPLVGLGTLGLVLVYVPILSPNNVSLGHIDEPMLDGEEWSHVVLQGFSTRSTWDRTRVTRDDDEVGSAAGRD